MIRKSHTFKRCLKNSFKPTPINCKSISTTNKLTKPRLRRSIILYSLLSILALSSAMRIQLTNMHK